MKIPAWIFMALTVSATPILAQEDPEYLFKTYCAIYAVDAQNALTTGEHVVAGFSPRSVFEHGHWRS
jgi:hypothetical protein